MLIIENAIYTLHIYTNQRQQAREDISKLHPSYRNMMNEANIRCDNAINPPENHSFCANERKWRHRPGSQRKCETY